MLRGKRSRTSKAASKLAPAPVLQAVLLTQVQPEPMTKLASHWTSSAPQLGCRHFRVVTVGGKGSERWVELEPLLKPSLRLRLKLSLLRDRQQWCSGLQAVVETEVLSPAAGTTEQQPAAER